MIEAKICAKYGLKKELSEFQKRPNFNTYYGTCKKCKNVYSKQYRKEKAEQISEQRKQHYRDNKEDIKEYMKQYREDGKEILKDKQRIYNKNHLEGIRERTRKYITKNIEKIREYRENYRKEKISNDPLFKLTVTIRHLISNSSRRQGYTKKTRTYKILGCDYDEFNKYLLETYKNNYGHDWDEIKDVHIDHIISLATATSEEEIIKLCHYSNLQLLKAKDNLDKKDKFD